MIKTLSLKQSISKAIPRRIKASSLGKHHMVHGDYHAQNLFFNSEGQISHVFDLERTGAQPRSLELVRSMFLICFNSYFSATQFKQAKIYLQSYNQIYPINKSEVEHAVRFMFYKHALNLWIEKDHYLHNFKRADTLLSGEFRYLKYMSQNLETFIQRLLC